MNHSNLSKIFVFFVSILFLNSHAFSLKVQIEKIESKWQDKKILHANTKINYIIPGTPLQILPTEHKNGHVRLIEGTNLRLIAVYDPTVKESVSALAVDCEEFFYFRNNNPSARFYPLLSADESGSYTGALVYAACHLKIGN